MELITEVLALGDHESQALPEVDIPDWATWYELSVYRCTTPDLTIWPDVSTEVGIHVDIALDGTTWQSKGGFTSLGGIEMARGGGEQEASMMGDSIAAGVGRKQRVQLSVTNGPCRTHIAIKYTDE